MGVFTFLKLYKWYQIAQRITFAEDNSSIGSIVTGVVANEVKKMNRKDVCKYSLNLAAKVMLLLLLTNYFKGLFAKRLKY